MLNQTKITSIYPIELATPAPYPLIWPFYLQTPNSNVNQYNVPSLAISSSDAPRDNNPIVCDKALIITILQLSEGQQTMAHDQLFHEQYQVQEYSLGFWRFGDIEYNKIS